MSNRATSADRSDVETLQEIARQIREHGAGDGVLGVPAVAPATAASDDPADLDIPDPEDADLYYAVLARREHEQQETIARALLADDQAKPAALDVDAITAVAANALDPDHLAKLAHELKTPLTAIAAAAEVMRDEQLGPMGNDKYRTYAADIHESATHALNVITSLLAESRKPQGAPSRLIALDLNALVTRTVSSMNALAEQRQLSLVFDAETSNPTVIANPTALRQILLNLLTNAIKFTPPQGNVRVVTGYFKDGRVYLAVGDSGVGMDVSPEAAEVVAAPEDHSEDQISPALKGNGIGLPLVRRLVREMGGEIEIDSAPGKGTVVLIAFGGFARWQS